MKCAPAARGSQDAAITQPRDHSLADPCIFRVGESILEESPAVCILKREDELGAERVGRKVGRLNNGKHCEFCLRKVTTRRSVGPTGLGQEIVQNHSQACHQHF